MLTTMTNPTNDNDREENKGSVAELADALAKEAETLCHQGTPEYVPAWSYVVGTMRSTIFPEHGLDWSQPMSLQSVPLDH